MCSSFFTFDHLLETNILPFLPSESLFKDRHKLVLERCHPSDIVYLLLISNQDLNHALLFYFYSSNLGVMSTHRALFHSCLSIFLGTFQILNLSFSGPYLISCFESSQLFWHKIWCFPVLFFSYLILNSQS